MVCCERRFQVSRGLGVVAGLRVVFAGLVFRREPGKFHSLDLELEQMHSLGRRFRLMI